MKVGLALGSGGARGLAHIGVMQALRDSDIPIHCISGSSMGALVGAVYASSGSVEHLENLGNEFTWRSMYRLFLPTISKEGLIDGGKILEMLKDTLPVKEFDDLQIPLALETTDLQRGECCTLADGELAKAIRASISIPLIFTPVRHDGRILVDGGLVSPVPVTTARNLGAEFVIAVNVLGKTRSWLKTEKVRQHFKENKSTQSRILGHLFRNGVGSENLTDRAAQHDADLGFMMILTQTVGISISKLAALQLQVEQPDILIAPDTSEINIYDFHRGDDVIDTAYQHTLDVLDKKGHIIRQAIKK